MRLSLVLVLAFSLGACGKKAPDAPNTVPPTSAPATSAPATTAPATATSAPTAAEADVVAAPAEDIAQPVAVEDSAAPVPDPKTSALDNEARALLTTWVKAQNDADFAAYSGLYAARFTGIKRSGPRQRTYGHATWLADRGRMFKTKMQVDVDAIEVAIAGDSAIVQFKQTWASGTYRDVGPKQLVLVPSAKGLEIAREEMLVSELDASGAEPKAIDPMQFVLGVDAGDASYVVIPAEVEKKWGKGSPKLVRKEGPTTVVQAVDLDALPADLKAWVGRKLKNGGGCEATIDRLELVGRYVPHFGTVQMWNGTDGVNKVEEPMSDDAIAASSWDSSAMPFLLVGHLSACGSGWLYAADHPAPTVFVADAADATLEPAAIAEFRKLAGWKATQAEAKQAEPPVTTATWDVWEGTAPAVHAFSDATSGRTFVQVTAQAGNGCGEFGGAFGAIFEVKNKATKPTFVLLTNPEGGPTREVSEVIDLDGDGDVEFVLDQGLIQRVGPIWTQTLDVSPPDYDCPC